MQPDTESKRRFVFRVDGHPVPQGSKKYMGHRGGKPILLESAGGLKSWRENIAWQARSAAIGTSKINEGPVKVKLLFEFHRPKSAPRSRMRPSVRPDIDKLARAALDALTGVLFRDDSQVVSLSAHKFYTEDEEGLGIEVEEPQWS